MDDYSDIPEDQRYLLRLIDSKMETQAERLKAHTAAQEGSMNVIMGKLDNVVDKVDQRMAVVEKRQDKSEVWQEAQDRWNKTTVGRLEVLEHALTERKNIPADVKAISHRVEVLELDKATKSGGDIVSRGLRDWIKPIVTVLMAALLITLVKTFWYSDRTPAQVNVVQQQTRPVAQSPTPVTEHQDAVPR
jgi:hypothetical protein